MPYDDYKTDNTQPPRPGSGARTAIGAAVVGLGLVVAVGAGILISNRDEDRADLADAYVTQPQTAPVEVQEPPGPTPEELASAEALREAQGRVQELEAELAARNEELAKLQQGAEEDEAAKARARERARAVQNEIASLRVSLAQAEAERDQLRVELKEALAEVDRQIEENRKLRVAAVAFKEASNENLWHAFTNNAKVRICERGTRRGMERCKESVDEFFTEEQHARFTECVSTRQAVPTLWQFDRKEGVPTHASVVDAKDGDFRDEWHVVYCDPTLPESAPMDITEEKPQVFASNITPYTPDM